MTIELWFAYVATLVALMVTPGPGHLLMASNTIAHGFGRASATAVGDLSANVLQMLVAAFGLAAILATSAQLLTVVKWAGVAYLAWMGWSRVQRAGRGARGAADAVARSRRAPLGLMWFQGFATAIVNPKAIVFFATLFPQFLTTQTGLAPQLAVLMVTFIIIDGSFLCLYGSGAVWLSKRLAGERRLWLDRAGGLALILAAALLALKVAAEQ